MQFDFEPEWRDARAHEANGNLSAAKDIYEALIAAGPNRLYVRLRLSAIERAFNNYRASRQHALKAAESVREGRGNDLSSVTRLLLTFDEGELVHDLIVHADWSDPGIVKDSAILSQHLWLANHVDDALRLIDTVRVRAPASRALSYARANALRYSGAISEATAEYERCLEIEPDAVLAHWSLAYHAKSDPPGVRIARIEKARLSFAHDAPEQAYLRYALFKEFDDAGNSDMAWQHLQAGSNIKRASTPFDSRIEGQGFAAMQALADEDFIHGHAQSIVRGRGQDTVPIFIVGMPRTGTTLLERIVGNHARVRASGELNDFNSALCIESNKFLGTALTPGLVDQVRDLDYSSIGDTYLHRIHGKAGGGGFIVDKNPSNFSYAALIGKALPHARILCLKRSPMDACLSNYKELFSGTAYGYSYDLGELADHYIRFAQLCDHWEGLMPQQFHVVEYEALVADTEDTARRIMEFCGIPFEPDSVDITKNTTAVSTASSSQVRQPINTRGIGAWRRYAPYLGPLQTRLESAFGPIR